jgi:hypothetical protein
MRSTSSSTGRRTSNGSFEYAGMMPRQAWIRTKVHEHTRYFFCERCRVQFASPQAAYRHLDKKHLRKRLVPVSGTLSNAMRGVQATNGSSLTVAMVADNRGSHGPQRVPLLVSTSQRRAPRPWKVAA